MDDSPTSPPSPLEALLEPDERIIWSGSPSPDRLLMKIDYFLVPLGAIAMIVGFVGFFTSLKSYLDHDAPIVNTVFWAGIFVLGFNWVVGHFIGRRKRALSTVLAITDERALRARVRNGNLYSVREVSFSDRPPVRVHPAYEGRATIAIGSVIFFNVPDAERVETLIRQRT